MHLFINWHIYSLSKFSKQTCFQGLVCPCLSGCVFTTSNQRISHNSPVVQVMAGFDACLSSKSKNVQTINSQDMAFLKTPRCEQLHNADAFRVFFFLKLGHWGVDFETKNAAKIQLFHLRTVATFRLNRRRLRFATNFFRLRVTHRSCLHSHSHSHQKAFVFFPIIWGTFSCLESRVSFVFSFFNACTKNSTAGPGIVRS